MPNINVYLPENVYGDLVRRAEARSKSGSQLAGLIIARALATKDRRAREVLDLEVE